MKERGWVLGAPVAAIEVVRRNKVSSIVIFVLLVALATSSLGLWDSPIKLRNADLPPPAAGESFVRGQTNFDAQLIWDALSDDFVLALEGQGADVNSIQAQLDDLRDSGIRYTAAHYVGGYRSPLGETYYLYIFSRENPQVTEGIETVPYVLILNEAGKIKGIQ